MTARTLGINALVLQLRAQPEYVPFRDVLNRLDEADLEFQMWAVEVGKKAFADEGMLTLAYAIREIEKEAGGAIEKFRMSGDADVLTAQLKLLEQRLRALPADLEKRAEKNPPP